MRVNGYTVKHNERMPFHVMEYLEERIESLANRLERTLGEDYDISFSRSRASEACYITIMREDSGYGHKVSFRNHKNVTGSIYDSVKWLSNYDTWTDCKKEFMKEDLPAIIEELLEQEARDAA